MGIVVEELITRWGLSFDTQKLQSINSSIEKLKGALATVAVGFAAASAAAFGMAKFTSDAAAQIEFLALKTGMTTDAVQKLGYAVKSLSGLDFDQFNDLMQSFTIRLQDAVIEREGEAFDALSRLRIPLRQIAADGKNVDDVFSSFMMIADKLQALPAPQRIAFTDKLFEGESEAAANIFRLGSDGIRRFMAEAIELGLVMDKSAIAKANEFRLSINRLMGALTGLRNVIGVNIMPAFTEAVDETINWIKANREFVTSMSTAFAADVVVGIRVVATAILATVAGMGKMIEAVGGVDKAVRLLNILMLELAVAGTAYLLYIAAVPSLVLAAMTAIALIVEDIMTFMEGGDSVFGDMIEGIKQWYNELSTGRKIVVWVFGYLLAFIPMVIWGFAQIIYYVAKFFIELYDKAGELKDQIKDIFVSFGDTITQSIGESVDWVWDKFKEFVAWVEEKLNFKGRFNELTQTFVDMLPKPVMEVALQSIQGFNNNNPDSPASYVSSLKESNTPPIQTRRIERNQSIQYTYAPQLPPLPPGTRPQDVSRALERSLTTNQDKFAQFWQNQQLENMDYSE